MTATKRGLTVFAVALVGSALLGAVAGLIWGAVAPRALFQVVTQGEAQLANPESNAFILADVWFCGIAAVGGLITGLAGVRLLVRKDGWPAAAGLVLGAVAAAFVMMWIGGLIGLSTYNHQLATAGANVYFNNSLALSAKSVLSFWLLVTAAIIALTSAGSRAPALQLGEVGPASDG